MNVFIATVQKQTGILTQEESWHCAKVLRKKAGDPVHLIDGVGNFYEGVLELVSEKESRVSIQKGPITQERRGYHLHLAIAPTKQIDRIEWMIEKAVEIGIDKISFVNCKNSERTTVKIERIKKIVESAVKQSLQAFIPEVKELRSFKDLVEKATEEQKLIAHCFDLPKKNIKSFKFGGLSTLILIGPEGDFSMEEVQLAQQNNFDSISLGSSRLRSETAGLYVCQAVSLLT